MSLDLTQQAVKPRGNNPREKLAFLIGWYEKTSEIETKDPYQINLINKMVGWAKNNKNILNLSEDEIVPALLEQIEKIKDCRGAMEQYLKIELERVVT